MKNSLLLLLFSIFVLSCTEYDDDGLPGDIVITNPDGSKKIKHYHSESELIIDSDTPDSPTPISVLTSVVTDINYDTDTYGSEGTISTTIELNGMDGFPDMDNNSIETTLSTTMENNRTTQMRTTIREGETTTVTRTNFAYTGDNITSITQFENNVQVSQTLFSYNDDNIVVAREFADESFGTETMTLNVSDNLITSAVFDYSFGEPINISIDRDSLNITQMTFTRGNESYQASYTYDNANYFTHNLGSENSNERLLAELISLCSLPLYTTESHPDIDLSTLESGLRNITKYATKNLVTVTADGQIVAQSNITYDEDNYPIMIESSYQNQNTSSVVLGDLGDTLYDAFIGQGLSEEEAQQMVDNFLLSFQGSTGPTQQTEIATITYFE